MTKHTLANPPRLSDTETNELAKWAQQEFQKLINRIEKGELFRFEELHAEPEKRRDGMQAYADGTDWNPGSGEGLYVYLAGAWVKITTGTGFLTNAYDEVTDGTTSAQAAGGDTLKFRKSGGLTVTVQSNDGTHGDNVTYATNFSLLDPITTLATDDYVVIRDTSGAVDAKILVTDFLKVINSLTEETSVDAAADFLIMYDNSAGAVRKVKPQNVATGWTLIQSQAATSGSTIDFTIPAGYKELRFVLRHISISANQNLFVKFSEDAGSTFLNCGGAAEQNTTLAGANGVTDCPLWFTTLTNTLFYDFDFTLLDYTASDWKFIRGAGATNNQHCQFAYQIQGTGTINLIRFDPGSTATFDNGVIELWGLK